MNYQQAIDYILSIPKFGVKSGLDNISILLDKVGNPQKQLKCIHVAGTNGKGSVCSMLSYILKESGYKVGLFTSPHLIKYNERIKVNHDDISDANLVEHFIEIKEKIDEMVSEGHNHPTYFEVTTALAFLYFYHQKVDYAILETGLGGRLDATNVIENPLVSVITWIGLDHIHVLGDNILDIAKEKAGIIKTNSPTVLYPCDRDILQVVSKICEQKNSKLYYNEKIQYKILKRDNKSIDFSIDTKYYNYKSLCINTIAEYQILNASIALLVVKVLNNEGVIINSEAVKKGLYSFKWAGRMELLSENVILDGAHNLEGIQRFVEEINNLYYSRPKNILFACMKDKPYQKMVQSLKECNNIDKIIITQMDFGRAVDVMDLESCFKANGFKNITKFINKDEAIDFALKSARDERILCSIGSLYLIGYIREIMNGKGELR